MLPFFYHTNLSGASGDLILDEATSRHCIQVLRMARGAQILLCNGKGTTAIAEIIIPDRKKCQVAVLSLSNSNPRPVQLSVGIAFTKNKSRNEWFLEKATELGIEHIYPLIVQRSEKEKYNAERYEQILVSAMLQSQQAFMPSLHTPQKLVGFLDFVKNNFRGQQFIAHCINDKRASFLKSLEKEQDSLILIGPEGDFSPEETDLCMSRRFIPVQLGENRLRTETAGLYACTVFNAFHYG